MDRNRVEPDKLHLQKKRSHFLQNVNDNLTGGKEALKISFPKCYIIIVLKIEQINKQLDPTLHFLPSIKSIGSLRTREDRKISQLLQRSTVSQIIDFKNCRVDSRKKKKKNER